MKRYLHNSLKILILSVGFVFYNISYSSAQILTFEFSALLGDEVSALSNTNDPNLNNSTITRGGGVSAGANGGRYNSLNWTTNASLDAADYVQFTITPNAGYQFSISSIYMQHQRSGTGPVSFVLRSSLDSYTANLGGVHTIGDVTTTQNYTFTFTQSNQSIAVTYRIYAYSAEAGTGTWGPGDGTGNDIVVNGTTSAISGCIDPVTQASSVTFSSVTSSSMTVAWTRGGTPGDGVIVVAKEGSAPTDPVDGTSYTANTIFGSGSDCGSDSYVVFLGSGTSVTVTGLTASTTYYFEVFEKNCTGTSIMINTNSPGNGSQATTAPSSSCGSETFTNSNATASYADNSFTGDNGVTWNYTTSRNEDVYGITGKGIMLRGSSYGSNVYSGTVAGGIGDFTCSLKKGFTGAGNRQVELFVNGTSQGVCTPWDNTTVQTFTVTGINITGNVVVEVRAVTDKQVVVDDISWTCYSGTAPTITVSPNTFTGFTYIQGFGPSTSQSYSISGSNLTGFPGNITITGSANYQVSLDNSTFSGSVNVAYGSATLSSTPIYVRLKSGLSAGAYNSENITNAGGGAATQNVTCNGNVTTITTAFQPGDFALLSVNSNISCLGAPYSNGDDQISFMIFKDINPGDAFILTDNGYERLNAGEWGNSEGTYQITRTTSTITAGTVITIRLLNASPYFIGVFPDNNWSMVNLGWSGTSCVLNSGGDQFYFMQGGTWNKGTKTGLAFNQDATYTPGVFLYAFNTNSIWTSFVNNTQNSGLIGGMECFNLMPGVATDYIEYTGSTAPASKLDWLDRLNLSTNWTPRDSCSKYFLPGNNIHYGQTYSILAGGYVAGVWTGNRDIDWFNCGNWQNLTVPDLTTNVSIPSSGVVNEPTIGAPPTTPVLYTSAECNNISIQSGRTLTLNNNNSILDIYGNIVNGGSYSHTLGIVNILNGNSTLSSTLPMTFYNLALNKTANSNTFTIGNDITISNVLTLTSGILTTGNFKTIVSNTSTVAITGYGTNSFINGNLRRNVLSTGSYNFPVGTTAQYEASNITLNAGTSGVSYIDAKFTTPHSTPIDITALGLTIGTPATPVTILLDYGFWTIAPDAGTFNYDVTLTSRGHTNGGATASQHTIVKRANSGANWATFNLNHNNATQSGTGSSPITAKLTGLTSFCDFAIARSTINPLPIELVEFSGKNVDNVIQLDWQTMSEMNNDYFEILKSNDLSYFEKIGTVAGAGNSNTLLSYDFIDNNPFFGNNYYKLKQVDFNGKYSESNVIVVGVNKNTFVNVFLDKSMLNISTPNIAIQSVEIIDITGKYISSLNNISDNNDIRFNISTLSQGIYFIRIIGDSFTETRKIYIP